MSDIIVNGTTHALPDNDGVAQKVPLYNAALIALAGMFSPAWASWTPTWTNLTVGNGTVTARHMRIGKLIVCRLSIVFGSTSSISGNVSFTLPVTSAAHAGVVPPLGNVTLYDQSTDDAFLGWARWIDTTHAGVNAQNASGTYLKSAVLSSSAPFTWTTLDEIACEFVYEGGA